MAGKRRCDKCNLLAKFIVKEKNGEGEHKYFFCSKHLTKYVDSVKDNKEVTYNTTKRRT